MYLSRLVVRIEPGDPAQDPNGFLCPVFLLQDLGLPAKQSRIFKLLRSPRTDAKEPIPPGCVVWRAGTTTYSYSVPSPRRLLFKNSSADQPDISGRTPRIINKTRAKIAAEIFEQECTIREKRPFWGVGILQVNFV